MITVGYQKKTYAIKRNIIGISDDIRYQKVINFIDCIYFIWRLLDKIGISFKNNLLKASVEFQDYEINKVALLHFFNSISFGKTPWIVTYETLVPRYTRVLACKSSNEPSFSGLRNIESIYNAVRTMAGSKCKKLIAMSKCSHNLQLSFLDEFYEFKDEIIKKMVILYPPQRPVIKNIAEKEYDFTKIILMFVGSAFFQKGGLEIAEILRNNKYFQNRFHLILVSSLSKRNIVRNVTCDDVKKMKSIIKENSDWIEFYPGLPNSDVLRLMKRAHIGLLPTYADTFGYSALEFQAAGCPVISTDVRALPEINNNEIGWLINVSKNRYGEAIYGTKDQCKVLSSQIETGLERVLSQLCNNPEIIYEKSVKSYNHVLQLCSIESYSRRLKEIYLASL